MCLASIGHPLQMATRHRRCGTALAHLLLVLGVAVSSNTFGQIFPVRPIKLVTAGAPGSVPDTVARPLADKLSAELHQPVIVENRPGAGGIVAMDLLAKARPDGYTIGVVSIAQAVFNTYLFDKLPYDPLRDFTPVIKLVAGQAVIAAHPAFPASTLTELVALAKTRPGRLQYAVPQLGAPPHIFALLFDHAGDIDMVAVPFKSAHEALMSVIGGDPPLLFDASLIIAPYVKSGALKAIAVTGRERDPLLPDTPTLAESGLDVQGEAWIGLMVPAGVPRQVVEIINARVSQVLLATDLNQQYRNLGWHVVAGSADAFGSSIRDDHTVWGRVIRSSGLHFQ